MKPITKYFKKDGVTFNYKRFSKDLKNLLFEKYGTSVPDYLRNFIFYVEYAEYKKYEIKDLLSLIENYSNDIFWEDDFPEFATDMQFSILDPEDPDAKYDIEDDWGEYNHLYNSYLICEYQDYKYIIKGVILK